MKKTLNFISEAGMLKRLPRSGWAVLGIKDAESVAEHSFRCAVLGYVLARMEGVEPYKVLLMTLFNDIAEARTGDLHKMAQKYLATQSAEERVFREQITGLPGALAKELGQMRREYQQQKSRESLIARDADILECLIQAKEYQEHGFSQAAKFMKAAPGFLVTKAARKLWGAAKKTPLNNWWLGLSRFKR